VVLLSTEVVFQSFVKALETHWRKPVDLKNEQSITTEAYWDFCNIYMKEELSGALRAELG